MIVEDIYSDSIPALSIKDSAQRALYFMEFFKISHLPIVEDDIYVGIISDEQVLDVKKELSVLKDFEIQTENSFVYSDEHIYNAIFKMSQFQLSLLPVIDRDRTYLGTLTPIELIHAIDKMTSLDQRGGVLILKMGIRDYALGEIAQIIEAEQIKILSTNVQTCKDQNNIKLTLKLNTSDLSSIKASLERYDYVIDSSFLENQVIDDMHKNRLDELMHYLNI